MSKLTEILGLFCYDPETDGANTFNIPKALNENWEKIDQLVLLTVATAAAYDPEGSYAVGDYCTHGGKLHKCGTPIPSGETWNAEHWTETTVAAELAGKASAVPPEEYDLPLAEGFSNTGKGNCSFRKNQFGDVSVNGWLNYTSVSNKRALVANLPHGFRPKKETVTSGVIQTNDTYIACQVVVSVDGAVSIADIPLDGEGYIFFAISFAAA